MWQENRNASEAANVGSNPTTPAIFLRKETIMSETVKVNSSAISEVTSNYDTHVLTIQFVRGAEYDYPEVPAIEFKNLISAPSVGKYYNTHLQHYSIAS